ncbi:MAG: WD40 repeat domain-containing protein, partial [Gemmataceae bacterium]
MIALLLFAVAPPASHADALPDHAVARLGSARFPVRAPAAAALSADGSLVAALDGGRVTLFDAAGRRLRDLAAFADGDERTARLAFSPDGKRLALSAWRSLLVYDVATGAAALSTGDHLGSLTFSRDGKLAGATGAGAAVWTLPDAKGVPVAVAQINPPALALSPDGATLAAWGGESEPRKTRGVRLYDAATGKRRLALEGDLDRVHHALFTPDGASLLIVGREVALFDAATGERRWRRDLESEDAPTLRLSADGKTLLAADDGYARVLDVRTGRRLAGCVLPRGTATLDARFT